MSKLYFSSERIVFKDCFNSETVLLNLTPLENHSNVPTYLKKSDGRDEAVFKEWICSLASKFDRVNQNVPEGLDKMSVVIPTVLLIKKLLQKQRNYKVIEIGCDKGVLSYYLAEVLKHFNSNNQLVCLTDIQKDSDSDLWLDKISVSGAGDIVSRITAEYQNSFIQKDYFDAAFINGTVNYENPLPVIFNAINSLKKGGLLICIPGKQYFLSDIFQTVVDDPVEYAIENTTSVFAKIIGEKEKLKSYRQTREYKDAEIKKDAVKILSGLEDAVQKLGTPGYTYDLDQSIKQIGQAENDIFDIYSRINNLGIKFELNEFKEAMITYRVADTDAERKADAQQCRKKYRAVMQTIQNLDNF